MTRRSIHIALLALAALCYTNAALAQSITVAEAEAQLKEYFNGLSYWRFQYAAEDTSFALRPHPKDSVEKYNSYIIEYIQKLCSTLPALMTAELRSLQSDDFDFRTLVSADKKIRIYNWDTYLVSKNGGMYYNAAVQYRSGSGTKFAYLLDVPEESKRDGGAIYTDLITIKTKAGKTFYLAVYKNIPGGKDAVGGVKALEIVDVELKGADVFVATNRTLNNIDYGYDYSSNYNYQTMKEEQVVHLSKNNKKLYIPLVEGDQMTGRWLVYVFDGSKFVYNKNAK